MINWITLLEAIYYSAMIVGIIIVITNTIALIASIFLKNKSTMLTSIVILSLFCIAIVSIYLGLS